MSGWIFCFLEAAAAAALVLSAAIVYINCSDAFSEKDITYRRLFIGSAACFALSCILLLSAGYCFGRLKIVRSPYGMPPIWCFAVSAAVNIIGIRLWGVFDACKNRRGVRTAFEIAAAILIICALEVTVFNYSAISSAVNGLDSAALAPSSAELSDNISKNDDGGVHINNNSKVELLFKNVGVQTDYIAVKFSGAERWIDASVEMKDRNLSEWFTTAASGNYYSKGTTYFAVDSMDKLSELKLSVSGGEGVDIEFVELNPLIAMNFNLIRFFGLIVISAAVILIKRYEIYKINFDVKNKLHKAAVAAAAAVVFAVGISLSAVHISEKPIEYPIQGGLEYASPYVQQFDAFQKGQLYFDIEPDKTLGNLENVYDNSARSKAGAVYQWDRAFYNGKYYSYFGVAPIFTVYYPYYALTGKLPTTSAVCNIFSILTVGFMTLFALKLILTYCKKVNLLLLLLGVVTLPFAGCVFAIQAVADFYSIPVLAGMCFLMAYMWSMTEAYISKKTGWFVSCGIFTALCAASRPNLLIFIAASAPVLLCAMFKGNIRLSRKIIKFAAASVPVMLGAAAIMLYNYLRFDSVFEFGSTYQLTVSDISNNEMNIRFIFPAFFHYFIQPFSYSASFPFLSPSFVNWNNYTKYLYSSNSFGLFSMPIMLSLLAAPFAAKRADISRAHKLYIVFTLAAVAFLAFFNFSMGGVNPRYISDITVISAVIALAVIMMINERAQSGGAYAARLIYSASVGIILLTLAVGALLLFSIYPCIIKNLSPDLYMYFSRAFTI